MDLWTLLGNIVVLLAASLLLGGLLSRFGQSPLVGYLIAGMMLGGPAAPLRGGKFTTWEGGHRVPRIMWGSGVVSGRTCNAIVMAMDMLPTIASLAGAKIPKGRAIDGKNILPLVQGGGTAQPPHDTFYYYRANGRDIEGIRRGDWKYLENKDRKAGDKQPVPRLFNLADDIGESTNPIDRHSEKARQLQRQMKAFDIAIGHVEKDVHDR